MSEDTLQIRIEKALERAMDGIVDGGHHKMWVIDQMVRELTGCPTVEKSGINCRGDSYVYKTLGDSLEYIQWVTEFEDGEDGPGTYEWDEGIAP